MEERERDGRKCVISSMTEEERRYTEWLVITWWEEIGDGGKRKKKRSAFYDQGRIRRVARGSGRTGPAGRVRTCGARCSLATTAYGRRARCAGADTTVRVAIGGVGLHSFPPGFMTSKVVKFMRARWTTRKPRSSRS